MPDDAGGVARGRHGRKRAHDGARALTTRRVSFVCAGLVGILAATTAPAGAGTSTTGSLQSQASAIAAELARDNNQLNSLGEQYLTAKSEYDAASAAARHTSRVVTRIEHLLGHDRNDVAAAAIGAYVSAGSTTSLGNFLLEKPDEVAVEQTYLNFASDKLSSAIASYQGDETRLQISLAAETHEASVAKEALARTTAARTSVVGTLRREQQLYDSVQGQLARLVAAQLAAQQAAAAKSQAAQGTSGNQTGPPSLTGTQGIGTSPIPNGSLSQDFAELRNCEASGDYQTNTGNGYFGAYQFALATWLGLGETGLPSDAPPAVQDAAAYLLYQRDGWHPWPACSALLNL
ncbi:MAG: transglycosylase family protein [Acidimicrobiales bacterium]